MSSVPVVCFPYAGAGAGVYRRWRDRLPATIHLVPIQLPGREERFGNELPPSLQQLAQECAEMLLPLVEGSEEYAVLGHSFGAVVAYEATRSIECWGGRPPRRLIVSGAAGAWLPRRQKTQALTDDELVRHVQEVAGYQDPAFDHPELRALLVPTLRADMLLNEGYRPASRTPLAVPVTALRGRDDRTVSRADAQRWSEVTGGDFALEELPGGHLHLIDYPDAYWSAVARAASCEVDR